MTAAEIEKQEEELRAQIEEQKLNEVRDLGRLLGSLVSMPGRGALAVKALLLLDSFSVLDRI
jgi:hypothetical protein